VRFADERMLIRNAGEILTQNLRAGVDAIAIARSTAQASHSDRPMSTPRPNTGSNAASMLAPALAR
jgi:hypothetical protein